MLTQVLIKTDLIKKSPFESLCFWIHPNLIVIMYFNFSWWNTRYLNLNFFLNKYWLHSEIAIEKWKYAYVHVCSLSNPFLLNKACLPLCNQGIVFLGGYPCLTVEKVDFSNCWNTAQEELHYWRKEGLKQKYQQSLDGEHVERVDMCTFVEMCLCNYEIRIVSLNLDSYGYFFFAFDTIHLPT